jgi:hypothetical protein
MPYDSYMVRHEDLEYVALHRERSMVAVIDVVDGGYTLLTAWPKEIDSR